MVRSIDMYDKLLARSERCSRRIVMYLVPVIVAVTLYILTINVYYPYEEKLIITALFCVMFAGGLTGMSAALLDKSRADFAMDAFFVEEEENANDAEDASRVLEFDAEHDNEPVRLFSRDENVIQVGKYKLSHADWRILYFALADANWYWNKANVTKARRSDGSLIIPNLTGAAFSELDKEFRKLGFIKSYSRHVNGHGRRTLREAANLAPGN